MAGGGLTLGGGSGGVTGPMGIWFPTESGLQQSGGLFDRLTQALDARAQYQGQLRGYGPALRDAGVPVPAASPSFFSQLLGGFGLGATQQAPSSAPISGGGSGAPAPQSAAQPASLPGPSSMMGLFANAISGIESNGNYGAVGPDTGGGNRALGKYQVMTSNVGPWTKEVLGQELSPQQFLASPQAQEAVFNGKFGQYLSQTGNPRDAASMWFTGRPYAQGAAARDQLGTSGAGYVQKFMAALPGGGGGPQDGGMPAQATAYAPGDSSDASSVRAPLPARANGGPMMPQASASRSQPSQANALANSNTPGLAQGGAQGSGQPVSAGAVLGPLLASGHPAGAQAWQMYRQAAASGGAQGGLTLPGGMSPQSLAAMIAEPSTMQNGLAIWQKALFPQITSIEPNRAVFRGTQYLGQTPSAPMAAPLDTRIVNPNTGQVIAGASPKLDHGEIGRDPYGQPIFGAINPQTGQAVPFQAGQSSGSGAGTGAPAVGQDGQPLTGAAFLSTLPPAFAGQVKAYAEGRVKLPSGVSAASPMAQRMRAAVLQYDPTFDQAGVDARFETRGDFAKGDAAKTITAGNTALIHLGELADRIDKLGNADTSIPGNNYVNALKNSASSTSAAGAPIAAFNSVANKYVEEATKFYRGSGGTEADINRDIASLNANMSPTQLRSAIQAQIPLLQGKIDAMQSRWHQGMGPQAGDYPIVSPQAQAVIDRLGTRAGGDSGPASANLPTAAPATSAAPLDQARAAISRGAPRAAVIQRLQKMGIDPSGL